MEVLLQEAKDPSGTTQKRRKRLVFLHVIFVGLTREEIIIIKFAVTVNVNFLNFASQTLSKIYFTQNIYFVLY